MMRMLMLMMMDDDGMMKDDGDDYGRWMIMDTVKKVQKSWGEKLATRSALPYLRKSAEKIVKQLKLVNILLNFISILVRHYEKTNS